MWDVDRSRSCSSWGFHWIYCFRSLGQSLVNGLLPDPCTSFPSWREDHSRSARPRTYQFMGSKGADHTSLTDSVGRLNRDECPFGLTVMFLISYHWTSQARSWWVERKQDATPRSMLLEGERASSQPRHDCAVCEWVCKLDKRL